MDYAEKTRRCQEYIDALEEERRKIEVFHRELPFCFQLVSQAIDSHRQQMLTESLFLGRSECEEISGEGPVLEEFIPPSKRSSLSEEEKIEERHEKPGKKSDWLRSAQLWNQDPDSPAIADVDPSKKSPAVSTTTTKKVGVAFHHFHGEKKTSGTSASSTDEKSSHHHHREDKEGQSSNRKARRCWSPELHRRFLHALQQLGGTHAATPKQIREMMKVDGLTNDEVKSHLQKYRLHTSRPSPVIQSSSTTTTQPPQFLVVGGIWVPPPEYATMAQPPMEPTRVAPNGVYAPVATLPKVLPSPLPLHQEKQTHRSPTGPLQWERRGSHEDEDHPNSSSPTTSSSSLTTTTSPAF